MSRRNRRAAIFAAAATLLFSFVTTDGSGAYAQANEPLIAQSVPTGTQASDPSVQANEVRFVADEVVQPLIPEADESVDDTDDSVDAASLRDLVAMMDTSAEPSGDMLCLAQAIYFEARGEPLAGQLAVGRVVVNRADSSAFPDDYCSVVKQPAQFSFVKNGWIPQAKTGSAAWHRAKAIARIAHQELWDSAADDALFFHATRVRPSWARQKIARATIERHVFYR
jgi:spore germination cell wall hydrolase CwlJ-like protein